MKHFKDFQIDIFLERIRQGMKQDEVAKLSGMTQGTLNKIENYKLKMTLNNFVNLLDVFGYDVFIKERSHRTLILNDQAKHVFKIWRNKNDTYTLYIEKYDAKKKQFIEVLNRDYGLLKEASETYKKWKKSLKEAEK